MSDSTTTVRAELAALLTPLLPKEWLIVRNERVIDPGNRTVVRLSQQRIQRHPSAPQGALLVTFKVVIIAPGQDMARVEDELDDAVTALIVAIDSVPALAWTSCEKATWDESLGYQIDLTVTVSKTK